jgi:hypothetical protein
MVLLWLCFVLCRTLGFYIQALRFTECTPSKTEDAKKSLDTCHLRHRICTRSKLIAATTLGLGGVLEAVAVILFIFLSCAKQEHSCRTSDNSVQAKFADSVVDSRDRFE